MLSAETDLGRVGPKPRFVAPVLEGAGHRSLGTRSLVLSVQWLPSESGFSWQSRVCLLLFLGLFLEKQSHSMLHFGISAQQCHTQPGHRAKWVTSADSARPCLSFSLPTQGGLCDRWHGISFLGILVSSFTKYRCTSLARLL